MPRETAEQKAERLTTPVPRKPSIPPENFLSSGSTVMNLAFSGHRNLGIPKGAYLYIVGDSGAMKTWETFTLFAEAARNDHFKKYRFVHDNAENGALMDVSQYFGQKVLDRLEPPHGSKRKPIYSSTVKEFYMHLELNCKHGPCIYALDSMDALEDDADEKRFDAELKKYLTGKGEIPGSYGMEKAKTNSKNISRVVNALRDSGSILVIISQTRDKIGGMIPGQKTRAGGRALRFYAHLEIWTSVRAPLVRRYLGKEREVGSTIRVDVQKNRICGWEGKFDLSFIKGYGIDDLGSCVEYLIEERHWKKVRGSAATDDNRIADIAAPEFKFTGKPEDLIQYIQSECEEWQLRKITEQVWQSIIDGAIPDRKPRYT